MGSRMMHYAIAKEVAKVIEIEDFDSFLLGALIPDASRDKSLHYYVGSGDDYSFKVDLEDFFSKLKEPVKDYDLGYLTHLVADDFWMRSFYLGWLRMLKRQDESILEVHYNDFLYLNSIILNKYKLEMPSFSTLKLVESKYYEKDFHSSKVECLIDAFESDFLGNTYSEEDLVLHQWLAIKGYIDTCVERAVQFLQEIRGIA